MRIKWTTADAVGHEQIDPEANILSGHLLVWRKVTRDGGTVFMDEIVPELAAGKFVKVDPGVIRPTHVGISFTCGNHFSTFLRPHEAFFFWSKFVFHKIKSPWIR
jgi:hypothetical protein